MKRTADIAEFGAQLARECPSLNAYQVGQLAMGLIRLGRLLHRLSEDACNGVDRHTGEATDEAWTKECLDPVVKRVRILVAHLGIEPLYQGDPRGCVLKLRFKSGKTNDFGGEGWCVPAA